MKIIRNFGSHAGYVIPTLSDVVVDHRNGTILSMHDECIVQDLFTLTLSRTGNIIDEHGSCKIMVIRPKIDL